jgi:hypothetical protein
MSAAAATSHYHRLVATRISKAVIIRIPAELHAAVKVQASAEDRSMAQAVHYALRRYVEEGGLADDVRTVRPYTAGASFKG